MGQINYIEEVLNKLNEKNLSREQIQYPFGEFLEIYKDLKEEDKAKYLNMLISSNEDVLPSLEYENMTAGMVRIKAISEDYYKKYMRMTLETYDQKGISVYHSILAHYYAISYLEHFRRIKENKVSKEIIDSVTSHIFDEMTIGEIKDTYRFNTENEFTENSSVSESYNYSLHYLKDLKTIY